MSDLPRSEQADGVVESSVVELKKQARQHYRRVRRERSIWERATRSESLVAHALAIDALITANVVASFEPLATEPDIAALNTALTRRGIEVLLPIMLSDKDLTWRPLDTDHDLGKNAIARADVILTPALALGPRGERLGQGGGSYDRALPRRKKSALTIGVVWGAELNQHFPTETHDEKLIAYLTERGFGRYEPPSLG